MTDCPDDVMKTSNGHEQRVTDQQLTEWAANASGFGGGWINGTQLAALIADLRASRAEVAELREAFQSASDGADDWCARATALEQRLADTLAGIDSGDHGRTKT